MESETARLVGRCWRTAAWLVTTLVLLAAITVQGCKSNTAPVSQPPAAGPPQAAAPTQPSPSAQATAPPAETENRPAPAFTVTDVDGNIHSLGDYKGKILAIDFWATYCKPCVQGLREYRSLYQTYRNRGVEFLGLSMDESDAVIKGWRQENDWREENGPVFPLARLDQKTRAAFFGDRKVTPIVPIPQMRIIDRKGVIRYSFESETTADQVEAALKALLGERK